MVATDLWSAQTDAPLVAKAIARHCADEGDRMAVLHTAPGLTRDEARESPQLLDLDEDERQFATLYFPWIIAPSTDGLQQTVPPSGHVAGVWARTDSERGVYKAPANQSLRGESALGCAMSDEGKGGLRTERRMPLGHSAAPHHIRS